MFSNTVSLRDLAARIETRAEELAKVRDEQRQLQSALEVEQEHRMAAVAALHDALAVLREAVDALRARVVAIEGVEPAVAEPTAVEFRPVDEPGEGQTWHV